MKKVVTHNGSFHADDVFAIATLQLFFGLDKLSVTRTRDESVISEADIVVDVGGEYDVGRHRYDHHQNGAPVRENGIPYAGFGLVWKHFGENICKDEILQERIDKILVQPVDAGDNGVSLYFLNDLHITPFELYQVISTFAPPWQSEKSQDDCFFEAVAWAREFLDRLIQKEHAQLKMEKLIDDVYTATENKNIFI